MMELIEIILIGTGAQLVRVVKIIGMLKGHIMYLIIKLEHQMINGAVSESNEHNVKIIKVPGAFEIPGMANCIIENDKPDLIITLGVLIKGESDHFEYISSAVANSISHLSISNEIPIIFGVLTTQNMHQAIERAYVNKKNKGGEAMKTGLKMLKLYETFKN